jgi:hypothetical protein
MSMQIIDQDRQDSELPADHAGLELLGAVVPAASGDPGRQMEVSGGAAMKRA